MKMTHKIGVVTALLVSTAVTSDVSADKSAEFTYSPQVGVPVKPAPKNYIDAGNYFQQTLSFWNGGSDLNKLGVEVAYSFGL